MSSFSISPLVAVATGTFTSAWLAGAIASLSLTGVPTAQAIPGPSALIWHGLFAHGKALMPKVAVGAAISYSYAAYATRDRSAAKSYLAAAGLVLSIIPFTLLTMSSTNTALINAANGTSALGGAQVLDLIRKWGYLNLVRSCLPLAGGILAFSSYMSSIKS